MKKAVARTPEKAVARTPEKVVALREEKSTWQDRAKKNPGRGLSTAQDDNIVPIVRLLQALSPQVQERNPEYVKGARPGDIWLKDHAPPIIKGGVGILFQPCGFSKDYIEWRPRDEGGGFVRRWDTLPSDAEEEVDEKSGRTIYTRNGNDLIDTRYHAGFVIDEKTGEATPWVIPMKGTGHAVSRAWMSLMNTKRHDGARADSWLFIYRITTKDKTNAAGQTYSVYEIVEERKIETDEEYDRGEAMFEAFQSGAKRAETDDSREVAPGGDSQSM
jgi:hypothetical protein